MLLSRYDATQPTGGRHETTESFLVFWPVLLDDRSDLRRKRTVERNIRSINLRAFLIRFFRRLLKFFQLLFFLFLLAHGIRSLSFKIWPDPPTILTVQT
jgi:hypothetical protein